MRRLTILILGLIWLAPVGAAAQVKVDLELILMADGSGSVDDDEFTLQRLGYAQALRDPRVLNAIQFGPRRQIALSYVEWSGPHLQVPIIPWTLVRTKEDLEKIAHTLETWPRELYGGGTAVGNAIVYGAHSINDNDFDGRRRVVDISGDGPDKNGMAAADGRDRAMAMGMTINGLPILEWWPELDVFFRDNVIGGPGSFNQPAVGFRDVKIAIRKKLIREIAGHGMPGEVGPEQARAGGHELQ